MSTPTTTPTPPAGLRTVFFATAVTAIGGFLFGYDTAVINGANSFLQTHFKLEPARDSFLIGLATASAILGCIPGAMSAGVISDRFGRRRALFFCAALFALSGILSAIPRNFIEFIGARILSGLAIGVSSVICPVYIAEIAPPQWRGRLGSLFQLGIVTGIFVTLFINGWIQRPADPAWNVATGWRWMLAAEAVPAFLFLLLLLPIPESPRWLFQVGREGEARETLHRIGGTAYADAEIAAVKEVLKEDAGHFIELFTPGFRLPLLIAFVLMAGSQLSGINAIMYYSTEIFRNAAGDANAGFKASVWIGLINLLATFIAILVVDKAGPASAAAGGERDPGLRARRRRNHLCGQPAVAAPARLRHPLHRGLRHGDGPPALDRLLGDFPCKAPGAGDVRLDLLHLDRMPSRVAHLPVSAGQGRPQLDLLDLRCVLGGNLPVCAASPARDQGTNARGD